MRPLQRRNSLFDFFECDYPTQNERIMSTSRHKSANSLSLVEKRQNGCHDFARIARRFLCKGASRPIARVVLCFFYRGPFGVAVGAQRKKIDMHRPAPLCAEIYLVGRQIRHWVFFERRALSPFFKRRAPGASSRRIRRFAFRTPTQPKCLPPASPHRHIIPYPCSFSLALLA